MTTVVPVVIFAASTARWAGGILMGSLILVAYLAVSRWSRWRH